MVAEVYNDKEFQSLRRFPEIGREELIRFFTLTPADVAFVDPGRGRGPADRLGLAVTLCTLPWLGFVPDAVTAAPRHRGPRLRGWPSNFGLIPMKSIRMEGGRRPAPII